MQRTLAAETDDVTPREAWADRMSCALDVTVREHGRVIMQTYRARRDPRTSEMVYLGACVRTMQIRTMKEGAVNL